VRALLPRLLAACALAWGIAVAIAAVASSGAGAGAAGRLAVVASTTQAADLARQAGGSRVQVTGLLPPNADPHSHELSPGDVTALARARVVVRSGGDVDAWLAAALPAAPGHGTVLDLSRHVALRGDDPHWWQDPRNAVRAVGALRDAFVAADPGGAAAYRRAAAATAGRIRATDRAIAGCWAAVPDAQRRLVTSHDAYAYYAARYHLRVVGSVLPALSAQAQPSARAVARLVDAIRRDHVRAVFPELALNARVERAVAREAGARVGGELLGDTVGAAGTYLRALRADTRTLLAGLAPQERCAL
jgi:ABC-type Zn uptake system ZnuABC Zn-binding protein ZnuA